MVIFDLCLSAYIAFLPFTYLPIYVAFYDRYIFERSVTVDFILIVYFFVFSFFNDLLSAKYDYLVLIPCFIWCTFLIFKTVKVSPWISVFGTIYFSLMTALLFFFCDDDISRYVFISILMIGMLSSAYFRRAISSHIANSHSARM